MSITLVRKSQIRPLNIIRSDINTTTSGSALITKVIAGTGLYLSSSTGVNPGTGDVTIALSIATASVLGGVIIGSGLTVAVDGTISVTPVATTWGSITGTLSNQTDLQAALNAKYNNPTGTTSQYIDGTGAYQTFPSSLATGFVRHEVKAGVAINKGQAVYVTSSNGTNMIVGLASNASEATSSKTMGLLDASVSINGFANVVTEGLLAGLNTIGATAGDPVWLGTGGNLIYGLINKPYAPKHLVFIGIVTRVNANNGEIFVKVQNGFELKEIHDVDVITNVPLNGHVLGFNGTLWVNKTIAGWLGYTPQDAATAITTSNIGSQSVNYANSAGSATVAGYVNNQSGQLYSYDNRVIAPADTIEGFLQFGFTSWNNNGGDPYADYLHLRSYPDSSGGTDNLIMFLKSGIGMRIWQQSWGSNSPYAEFVDVWTTGNFTQTNVNNWNTAYSWGNHATQSYATQTYVNTAIANLVNSAPGTLDTLNELAAALGDDPNFATTVTNSIATKLPLAGGTMSGNINWDITDRGLTWGMNTDGAYIKFFNEGDGDEDSRLEYATSDNGDEYHRWVIAGTERMNLRTEGLNVNGVIYSSGYGNSTEWNTAYSWGNHAGLYASISHTHTFASITSKPTTIAGYGITNAYTDAQIQNFFNGANAITGYNKSNWDTAYSWGNHASAGYRVNSTSNTAYVYATSYLAQNYDFTLDPRLSIDSMSIKLWDNYFNNSGLGVDYGSLLDIYGRGGHVHSQFYMDASNALYYRSSPYAGGWNTWQEIWTSGTLTNLNQLVNGPGYITGYTETDTLQSVTSRGFSTNTNIWINRPSNKVDNNSATEFGSRVEFNNAFVAGSTGYTVFTYPTSSVFRIYGDYDGHVGGVQPDLQLGLGYLTVKSSGGTIGNVGIGTTNPTTKLEVVGDIKASGLYYNSTSGGELRLDNSYGGGIGYYADQNGHNFYTWGSTGWANKMAITDAGKVGIGTTTPAEELHVIGRGIFDGGSGNSSQDAVVYITKSTNDDWGLYVNNAGLDYGMYTRVSPSANYAFAIHNGTTWTTRITGNGTIFLGEKNAIEGNNDTWLRLNQAGDYGSGVYTPGILRNDGVFYNYGGIEGYNTIRSRKAQTAGDYTSAALWTESYDNTTTGIAFHISGNIGKFLEMRTNGILYWEDRQVWTAGNLTSLSQLANDPGYLTSLPSHNHDDRYYTEAEINSQIGDRLYQARVNSLNVDAFNGTGLYRGSTSSWSNRPPVGNNAGALLQIDTHPSDYAAQLFFDSSADRLYLRNAAGGSWGSWNTMWHSGNDGSGSSLDADLLDGFHASVAAAANSIPTRNASGYLIPESWIQLNGTYGLYSPTNGAHFYPNNGSYGSWRIEGSRNDYRGLQFATGTNGDVSLMIHVNSNITGFHNASYDWQFYWTAGTLYCFKNNYGGGTQATVLDSVNYTDYAATSGHTHGLGRWSLAAPANIDGLTATNFRNTLFGSASNTWNISTARWNTTPTGLSGMNSYGTMLAWSGSDTHGFIAVDYSTANIQVGGGSADNITWKATLIHNLNIGSYALTSYTETDTLNSVTSRGASTSNAIEVGGLTVITRDADVTTYQGRFQVYNASATGNLGYRIQTDEQGGWRWQFVDGGNNEYFGVDYPSGDITVKGTITEQSSLRYKENIINLESITEKVDRLRPVRYNKIGNTNTEIGLIAEEVAEIFPEFVNYNADGEAESLNYTRLSVVLLQTVKELSDKINKLETK